MYRVPGRFASFAADASLGWHCEQRKPMELATVSREELRAGPFEVAHIAWQGANSQPKHEHPETRVFVVLQGAFRERLFGTTVDHGPGSVVVRDAHQPHSDRYGSAGGLYVRIAFEDSALAASLPAPTRHPRIIPAVDALAANLRNEIQRSDGWSALASHGVALELLATLGRHDRPERSRPPWVHVVCEALHDDPSRPWSLTELGHLVDVDPVRLSRTFRRCIRMSVGSYLRTLRVHEAKRQIERSRNTLSKIAVDLGFSDQSHLNRAFREAFGLSAGAHRMRAASTIAAFNRPICSSTKHSCMR